VIDNAIDEARRIFGRITSYTIYRVALTMDIMFLVVLSTVFLNFSPLTAIMIVIMSLLDDVPIMTIAYDNTPVSEKPIRWRMPRLLGVAAVLGLFSIAESFALLLIGIRVLSHPHLQQYFALAEPGTTADGHIPAARCRRPFVAVRDPDGALVLPAAIPGNAARRCDPADPGRGGADVRLRLARPVHPLVRDRMGVGLQYRLDVRTRRRSTDYGALRYLPYLAAGCRR
jgi:hypothetical protein